MTVGRMSASAFRYVPRPDGHAVVRDRIVDLVYTFARVSAVLKMRVLNYFIQGRRGWVCYSLYISIFSSKDEPEDGGWGFLSRWGSFRAF